MAAGPWNFVLEKGIDWTRIVTWKPGGVLANLTGYTAKMHLKNTVDDAATLLELTTANGRITLGGVAGTITLNLTNATTSGLSFTEAVYDLKLISSTGITYRLLEGKVAFSKQVTV